jgi:NAD kinase
VDKIVVVTRRTRLEELVDRFNTLPQAKFYIEHMGVDFSEYEREHEVFCSSARRVLHDLDRVGRKVQRIDWSFLPNFIFAPGDAVVVLGRDGLVSNTAKYLNGQPIVGVNPDPERIDGILLPFDPRTAAAGVARVVDKKAVCREITMAAVQLNDGQQLLAFNDFYLGQSTHVSSRYSLSWRGKTERQSSSGVLVSTGAGSTGWLSSTQNMAAAVSGLLLGDRAPRLPVLRLDWEDPRLAFVVREPFRSRSSEVRLTAGLVEAGEELSFESHMPEGGVIFSDGIEADALSFNAGTVASVRAAERKALLVAEQESNPASSHGQDWNPAPRIK